MVLNATRDPLESAELHAPTRGESRYIKSVQWAYTMSGAGAFEFDTSHMGDPGGHPVVIHRIEIDVIGALGGSPVATLSVHWDDGIYANHDYLLHTWSPKLNEHVVVPLLYAPLPFPHGCHYHLAFTSGTDGVVVEIHSLVEWI